MSPSRFRVGVDLTHRLYFVRDTVSGRCSGVYGTAAEAMHHASRSNRALGAAR